MPQMMPMFWLFMLLVISLLIMMITSFLYFFNIYYTFKMHHLSFNKIINSKWLWKW